jgi:uncharacterized protein YjiS (DUF1127 family)
MRFPTISGVHAMPKRGAMHGRTWRWMRAVHDEICEWPRRSRQRDELARMTDYERMDAGISACDAWHETAKPFWRA